MGPSDSCRKIKEPDLWALFDAKRRLETNPQAENALFTPVEQAQIEQGLFQLEEYVYRAEPDLSDEKRLAVAARFRFLKDAAARLGRVDWTSLAVGQLFSMVTEHIITVDTFKSIYDMLGVVFGGALQLVGDIAKRLSE